MAFTRPEEILAALEEGKPRLLIGTAESSQIDFKNQPYQLGTDKGKWELAKDVAGLANFAGGILVVGIRTEKTAGNFREIAADIRPVPVGMLNAEQHYSVIRDLVRPAVIFQIAYHSDPDQADCGYMTIRVEPLDEAERFALVRRMISTDERLTESIGVPIRDGDQTRWLSGDEVYRYLRDGQRAAKAMLATLTHETHASRGSEVSGEESRLGAEEAIRHLISFKDWDHPVLVWQSLPTRPVDLTKRMWGTQSIAEALRNHPSLRSSGFNWFFMTDPTSFDDGALASDGRHAIWVRENGTVTAAAPVKQDDMLTWAMRNPPQGPYRLNVLALVEMTLEYYRLLDGYILPGTNTSYQHVISTIGFSGEPGVILPSAPLTAIAVSEHQSTRDIRRTFPGSSNPEHEAYEALSLLYAAFRYGPRSIPFTSNDQVDSTELVEFARRH